MFSWREECVEIGEFLLAASQPYGAYEDAICPPPRVCLRDFVFDFKSTKKFLSDHNVIVCHILYVIQYTVCDILYYITEISYDIAEIYI